MLRAFMNLGNKNYLKSNKLILPLIVFFAYFGIAYSVGPQKVIGSLIVQAIFMFFLMVVISVTYCDSEYEVLEQIFIMKAGYNNKHLIYISKILVLSRMLGILTIISSTYPFIRYYFGFSSLFDRSPLITDWLLGLIVIFEFGFLGMLIGLVFNQSWIHSRKMQICMIVLVALLAVVLNGVVEDISFLRFIAWIIPPISSISKEINKSEYVSINAFWALGKGLIYCVVYVFLYLAIMVNSMNGRSIIGVNKKNK
ncbi:hypothetical protein [Anaerosporobacter sp.]